MSVGRGAAPVSDWSPWLDLVMHPCVRHRSCLTCVFVVLFIPVFAVFILIIVENITIVMLMFSTH